MLKLLLYGYSYGVRSSRKLEREVHNNLSFIWLMRQLKPDHKTIAEFRRKNKGAAPVGVPLLCFSPASRSVVLARKAEPEPEPFYEEIPVNVTVLGNFQNIVHFFEKVSKLPRIVNVSGVVMGDRKEIKGRGYLITASCVVKTYMFIDKEKTSEKQNEKK